MKQDPAVNINENDSHTGGSQLLGFLPPGAGVLILSPSPRGQGAAPPVMAIPIAELFVKHEKRPTRTGMQSDNKGP